MDKDKSDSIKSSQGAERFMVQMPFFCLYFEYNKNRVRNTEGSSEVDDILRVGQSIEIREYGVDDALNIEPKFTM